MKRAAQHVHDERNRGTGGTEHTREAHMTSHAAFVFVVFSTVSAKCQRRSRDETRGDADIPQRA